MTHFQNCDLEDPSKFEIVMVFRSHAFDTLVNPQVKLACVYSFRMDLPKFSSNQCLRSQLPPKATKTKTLDLTANQVESTKPWCQSF